MRPASPAALCERSIAGPRDGAHRPAQGSFNRLVDNYSRLADWVSSLERVGGLLLSLDRLNGKTRPLAARPLAAVEPLP
jgi:ABC-type uncharacterized transport system fused permease/ATPase subunit